MVTNHTADRRPTDRTYRIAARQHITDNRPGTRADHRVSILSRHPRAASHQRGQRHR